MKNKIKQRLALLEAEYGRLTTTKAITTPEKLYEIQLEQELLGELIGSTGEISIHIAKGFVVGKFSQMAKELALEGYTQQPIAIYQRKYNAWLWLATQVLSTEELTQLVQGVCEDSDTTEKSINTLDMVVDAFNQFSEKIVKPVFVKLFKIIG